MQPNVIPLERAGRPKLLFVQSTLVLIISLSLIVACHPKTHSFREANFFHCSLLDQLFIYYTFLGDGLFAVGVIVTCYLLKKAALGEKIFLAFVVSGLIAQLLKHLFRAPRPMSVLGEDSYAYFIDGITHSGFTSFPSGHATTAFAIAAVMAFNCKKISTSLIVFWMAVAAGYSRIYLGHHFLEDVLAGVITGASTTLLTERLHSLYANKTKYPGALPAPTHEQPTIEL